MDLLEKSSETRETSYKWSTTLSILNLLNIFSEVIVASKRGPEKHPYKRSTIKDQKSNFGIPLDLWKRSSKIRESSVSDPHLNMI